MKSPFPLTSGVYLEIRGWDSFSQEGINPAKRAGLGSYWAG